ncbi:LEAF RUST 10 DISEASE-RESISTANCE LOCUS RECEPTOR-LIKE PROTEIN KINASE-like 1.1 isoform X6 [Salvia hispanica]|uniref:LEAF RUST 10 DISEASE-RESISTANCE LOCUS RECEPTOR-LIKE PROTEIN KINASE-like 1.1 isoform X6 n=1 Tax=Salvia hispanica TaxID=49212 RepID=UPI0020094FB1|nr:LEAF RUST 10 DISEASE-RESISTANCE LOCUS RECEPTOR-LIKE PROTEIN KINASE-like 1.1 isoform X6 [Salvia hispanica]
MPSLLSFLFFYNLLHLPNLAASNCPKSFQCGDHFPLKIPFTDVKNPDCGLITVDGCNGSRNPVIMSEGLSGYEILGSISANQIKVFDPHLHHLYQSQLKCIPFTNLSLPKSPSISISIPLNLTFFTCSNHRNSQDYFENYLSFHDQRGGPLTAYYLDPTTDDDSAANERSIPANCGVIQLPIDSSKGDAHQLFDILTAEFFIEWNVYEACSNCFHQGGQCLHNSMNQFICEKENNLRKILLATLIPGSALLLVCALYIWLRKKKKVGSYLLSRNLSYDPSSKADIEDGSFNFGIPIFSYSELVEATGNFDPSKELGDGGFGTVYYGKLHDGREVAIKRLYEHNYRRVEQFLNEIKILTSLRHPNLVSLYGCTSRRSRELLLVYEYIPNGTVADHLHGQRAASAPLTWPMRMTIARETATALAYLHKSDIIHRDVKTNNILLDANFSVKVADFGLSRLFPNDVTHISTAPQGTPGYVDPEYHQCYQLTDKSDVYSFGVVLIELISSMPAVDISRHKHEINLANLAVSKIQKCAFDELIDPATGYNSDAEVTRMTTTVAELAFRCLQLDKDMRPTMEEVVAILHDIESGGDGDFEGVKGNSGGKIPPSPETDEVVLLKSRIYRSSPTAVTDTWISSASTTASSVG